MWNSALERDGMYIVQISPSISCLMIVHSTNLFWIFNILFFYMLRALNQRKSMKNMPKNNILETQYICIEMISISNSYEILIILKILGDFQNDQKT